MMSSKKLILPFLSKVVSSNSAPTGLPRNVSRAPTSTRDGDLAVIVNDF